MFKRLFGAEKSGGGSAPSAGSTGGGGGGKTTPLGAVEQLKDVRHPDPTREGVFFLEIQPRPACRVPLPDERLADVRETSRFLFFFAKSRRFFHRSLPRSGWLVRGLAFARLPATRH